MQYDLVQVRKNMKAAKITGVDIARATEHHPAWVNLCLRGEYPSYGAFGLPRDILEYLVSVKLLEAKHKGLLTPRAVDVATGPDEDDFCEHGVIRGECLICPPRY